MSEDINPYILIDEIYDLCGELHKDLSDQYWDNTLSLCREDISKIREKLDRIENWIKEKEELNKKAEG